MKRLTTRVWRCLAVLAIAAPAQAQFGAPAKVTVAEVELRRLPASTVLVGTVEPITRSVVGAEIAGLVERFPVRQGDFVRAGDLICKLKDETVALELAEAQAWLKSLEADHRRWKFELERIQSLYGDQDASEKEIYETRSEHDQTHFNVVRQTAVVARLGAELAKTEIRAPFSGFVVQRHAEVGQWLNMGGDVVELADLASVLITVDVPEQALPYVRVDNTAQAAIDALNQSFEGRVRHVMLQADPTARTFPVEIEVPNPGYVNVDGEPLPRTVAERETTEQNPGNSSAGDDPGQLASAILAGGMFARVTIQAGPEDMTPAVPKDAVVNRNGVNYVAMVAPGHEEGSLMAMPMPVTTGLDIGDWIAVTSGNLAPGMRVVVKGNENILFPSPIEMVKPLDSAATAPAEPPASPPESSTGS